MDERKGKPRGRGECLELTLYLRAGKRTDLAVAGKLSVAWGRPFLVAILKRALPMRWQFSVDWGVVEGRRAKRWQRASVGGGRL